MKLTLIIVIQEEAEITGVCKSKGDVVIDNFEGPIRRVGCAHSIIRLREASCLNLSHSRLTGETDLRGKPVIPENIFLRGSIVDHLGAYLSQT